MRLGLPVAVVVGLVAASLFAFPALKDRLAAKDSPAPAGDAADESSHLVPGRPDTLWVDCNVAAKMGVRTAAVGPPGGPMTLELPATLILDANLLSHIHARFAGEIVEIGVIEGTNRAVDFGESVEKNQLLAVIWSRDLGEKKSELVDSLSQLRLDEETLKSLVQSSVEGAIPDRTIREAERKVEADRIAVSRVVRTLETWRVPQEEIAAVRAEADRLAQQHSQTREELVHRWARLEVRAPLKGLVLERNIARGDLVDTNLDLFKIADLSRLRVTAYAYEENLAALDSLPEDQRRWSVRMGNDPRAESFPGRFDRVGPIIDPNQHTALVMGWIDNRSGRLRVGQFATATVHLGPDRRDVAIPAAALVEEGPRQYVFVEARPGESEYARRAVSVSRRSGASVLVRTDLPASEGSPGPQALRPGERIVVSGAVPLLARLKELQAAK